MNVSLPETNVSSEGFARVNVRRNGLIVKSTSFKANSWLQGFAEACVTDGLARGSLVPLIKVGSSTGDNTGAVGIATSILETGYTWSDASTREYQNVYQGLNVDNTALEWKFVVTAKFIPGSVVGMLSEIGVDFNGSEHDVLTDTRVVLQDAVEVEDYEELEVVYEFRNKLMLGAAKQLTVSINGTDTDFTITPRLSTSHGGIVGFPHLTSFGYEPLLASGDVPSDSQSVVGDEVDMPVGIKTSHDIDFMQHTREVTLPKSYGNFVGGGIRCITQGDGDWLLRYEISPAIPKTSFDTVKFSFITNYITLFHKDNDLEATDSANVNVTAYYAEVIGDDGREDIFFKSNSYPLTTVDSAGVSIMAESASLATSPLSGLTDDVDASNSTFGNITLYTSKISVPVVDASLVEVANNTFGNITLKTSKVNLPVVEPDSVVSTNDTFGNVTLLTTAKVDSFSNDATVSITAESAELI